MNNYLILRSQNSPYNDVTKSSVLSFAEMDDNFIFLKGNVIYTATSDNGIVTLKKYNGEDIIFSANTPSDLPTELATFDTLDPNLSGTTFDPSNLSANTDTLYVSDVDASTWIYSGGSYQTKVIDVPATTPFFLYGTSPYIDAGGNKTAFIQRNGPIIINSAPSNGNRYAGYFYSRRTSGEGNGVLIRRDSRVTSGYGLLVQNYKWAASGPATVNQLRVNHDGSLLINDAYTLPNVDGLENQTLLTDGNGNITWKEVVKYDAGPISGATGWSSTGTGQINLPTIKVALYDNANNLGGSKVYDIASGTTNSGSIPSLTDNDTNYIVVEYNGGSPIYNVYNNDGIVNDSDVVLMYVVYRSGNFIHVLEFGNYGAGLVNKLNDRIMMTDRFGWESGLMISLSGVTGVVELSAGVAWNGPYRQTLVGVNSMDDVFFKNFHSGGTWTYTTTGNTLNNTYYDNGTDIVSATTGNYLVNYYYRGQEVNDHLYEVYGNGEYASVALAEIADSPSLPELITSHAFLVGRIIVEAGVSTGITQTAFGTVFQATGSAPSSGVHNDLTGLQGGAGGQYYHLTSDEYNNNTYGSGTNNYVARWTPDGSTLGNSIIQDNGVRIAVNGTPSVGDTMRVTTFSGDSTGLFVFRPNYTATLSNSDGISAVSVSQNSSETLVTGIRSQVSPSTYNTDTGYFGVKGVVGGTLSNPDSDFGLKVGVLGNYEHSTLSGYGVMGQVGGFNQADGVGVKGRFRDNVGDRVNNFIGVVGEVSYGKDMNGRVVNSAIGVYGTVDIYTTSEATSTNVGGKFDAKYSVNGSITNLHALYVDGVSTLSGGTITNGYGLYINSNTVTSGAITNKYGIYQVGSGDTNYFGGNLSVPNLEVRGQSNNPVYTAGTVTATHIPNWNNSNIQHVILSAATTSISGGTNIANGAVYTMILKQNASGSRVVIWDTQYKWQSGIAPVLSSIPNSVDILTFISDGTNLYGLIAKDFR